MKVITKEGSFIELTEELIKERIGIELPEKIARWRLELSAHTYEKKLVTALREKRIDTLKRAESVVGKVSGFMKDIKDKVTGAFEKVEDIENKIMGSTPGENSLSEGAK
jgi:t-SNARE complex subunit (syntaxin)